MFLSSADLPTAPTVPFFRQLNEVLERAGFDAFVAGLCLAFDAITAWQAQSLGS